MAKPTGSVCNLSCRYCFFLEKQRLYPGERTRMDDGVLRAYIEQYIEAQDVPEVTLAWQGGEPTLMGLDFFARSVEIAGECAPAGKRISCTMQTNGTLLDEEWCGFLRDKGFLVGLSLDGPREMHDAYRLDGRGRPTFDRVMKAARLMQECDVDFNVLCTVHAANAGHPEEVYSFFRDEVGVQWIQFIPIVERINEDGTTLLQQGDTVSDRSVEPVPWGSFLLGVFAEWLRRDVGEVHVNFFEAAFASWVGAPAMMCIFDETCGNAMALEYNGDLYSCDHFVEPGYLLGNIMREPMARLAASGQQRRFGEAKSDGLPRYCRECDVLFACRGECPKNRFRPAQDGEPGLSYLCEGYRAFFHGIDEPMKLMAGLYNSGRSPAEIIEILEAPERELRRAFARAGRNDPCPCGSGKKFKTCHGGMTPPGGTCSP
ncbi:MAG: anaerobic sulfatase maturase [Actinobacteria bacterium]|nr:anaerobic sulfatase maturase [Actinomycetota bacterium]